MANTMTNQEKNTVLYVEDNPESRLLVRRILLADDFLVMEAKNAVEALETVKDLTPDLILMDINMPDMDGYTLASKMKHLPNLSQVPIIALTANVLKGDRERSLDAGCDGYIQKPIDVDTIGPLIRGFLPTNK